MNKKNAETEVFITPFFLNKKIHLVNIPLFLILTYTIYYDLYILKVPFDARIIILKYLTFLVPNIMSFLGLKNKGAINATGFFFWIFYSYIHTKYVSVSYFAAFFQVIYIFTLCFDVKAIFIHIGFVLSLIGSYDAILHTHHTMKYFSDPAQGNLDFFILCWCILSVYYAVYLVYFMPKKSKQIQDLAFSSKGKGHSFVMHELVKPLNKIKQNPETALLEIEKMQNIITMAKELSSGELRISSENDVNLKELIENSLKDLTNFIDYYSIQLKLNIEDIKIKADQKYFQILISNLIRNAIEANEKEKTNKFISITLNSNYLEIENSHFEKKPYSKAMIDQLYTSKSGHMGFGLYLSNIILSSSHKKYEIKTTSNTFIFKIFI